MKLNSALQGRNTNRDKRNQTSPHQPSDIFLAEALSVSEHSPVQFRTNMRKEFC